MLMEEAHAMAGTNASSPVCYVSSLILCLSGSRNEDLKVICFFQEKIQTCFNLLDITEFF